MVTINNIQHESHLSTSVKQSIAYILLVPIIVSVIVIWFSNYRINDFRSSQIDIAESVVKPVSEEVSRLITENKRLLNIFVTNEQTNIRNLVLDPGNDKYKILVSQRIKNYFPAQFAFTVVNQSGEPIIDDFEGHIGEICLSDIKTFANTQTQNIQVHPNPYIYHIDSIANIGESIEDGFFFASFGTDMFSRLLSLSSPSNQSLMLINTQVPDLIEITEEGARIKLNRNNYALTDSEKSRILFSKPIAGASWKLVSFHDEQLFDDYNDEVFIIGFFIILLFLIGSILMAIMLWRAEQQKNILRQTKEEMFALFSHDLRSPLNSIYGTVQLLELDADAHGFDQTTQEMVSSAVNNAKHMISLINDLLDNQKLESGMMSYKFETIELNEFVQEIINLNLRFAAVHHIRLDFKPSDALYLNIDRQRMQQVITNLLSNAIKYSPTNGIVTVKISRDESNAMISVTDIGPGISDDIKDTIFDKFTQSKSSMTTRVGGTGLGLSIVKLIIEEHGGSIQFESEKGKGATFVLTIPLTDSRDA